MAGSKSGQKQDVGSNLIESLTSIVVSNMCWSEWN